MHNNIFSLIISYSDLETKNAFRLVSRNCRKLVFPYVFWKIKYGKIEDCDTVLYSRKLYHFGYDCVYVYSYNYYNIPGFNYHENTNCVTAKDICLERRLPFSSHQWLFYICFDIQITKTQLMRWACRTNNKNIISVLRQDLNCITAESFIEVAKNGDIETLKILTNNNISECSPYYLLQAFMTAVLNGKLNFIKFLNPSLEMIKQRGNEALILAVVNGHLDIVKYLWSRGLNVDDLRGYNNDAIHWAALNGYREILEFLYSCGLNVNDLKSRHNYALKKAAENGHYETVRFLCSCGLTLDDIRDSNNHALKKACEYGHTKIVMFFCDYGLTVKDLRSENNCAFKLAAANGHRNVLEYLWSRGLKIGSLKASNNYALINSASRGHQDVVMFLCQSGLRPNDIRTNENEAIYQAAKGGYIDLVKYLYNQGLTKEDAQMVYHRCQPIMNSMNPEVMQYLQSKLE